ncbi:MAG: rRNA maturation RNase YbeY [Chitinophagia bacterium]|nr:rRNA maturation RNase YbeY [Chitinophagia bacterium]
MPANFTLNEVNLPIKDKRKLSAFLDALVAQHRPEVKKVRLQYIFCTDEFVHGINLQYLQHDTLTDIVTFDLSDRPAELKGEIYISVDRVKENATLFGTTANNELHRVIFHGALHLCGFKDKTKAQEQEMRAMENKCLEQYFGAQQAGV